MLEASGSPRIIEGDSYRAVAGAAVVLAAMAMRAPPAPLASAVFREHPAQISRAKVVEEIFDNATLTGFFGLG